MGNRLIRWDKANNLTDWWEDLSNQILFPVLFAIGLCALCLSFLTKETDNQLFGSLGLISLLLANSFLKLNQE